MENTPKNTVYSLDIEIDLPPAEVRAKLLKFQDWK
jgi:hypothetical protein